MGDRVKREFSGVVLLLFAAFLFGALIFQWPEAGAECWSASGPFGPTGTFARCVLVAAVGVPGTVVIALGCAAVGLALFGWLRRGGEASDWAVLTAGAVALLPVGVGLALGGAPSVSEHAGLWGGLLAHYLQKGFGVAGSWIVFLLIATTLTVFTVGWHPFKRLRRANLDGATDTALAGASLADARKMESAGAVSEIAGSTEQPALSASLNENANIESDSAIQFLDPLADSFALPPLGLAGAIAGGYADESEGNPQARSGGEDLEEGSAANKKSNNAFGQSVDEEDFNDGDEADAESFADSDPDELPPTELLREAVAQATWASAEELNQKGEKLMATLRTFKIDGRLLQPTVGPTVTQFAIEPASGVKVRQIAALADDLALAMRVQSIRIVAPIPGRGAVGVEIPNPSPVVVQLREVLESPEYRDSKAALPVALGKDLEGRPVVADLARMPHLLIAGATGSGKSVCVNTIITSLVYRHTPRTLRLLLVDPKMVELSVYNALPHRRHKVVTDNRDAAAVLKWAVHEMDQRYRLLEVNGCRNIAEFNRRVTEFRNGEGRPVLAPRNPEVAFERNDYKGDILPYLVVVIDEMADLMMTVQAEVETPIAMLAQKARAIGIHLILATQRPSVNVITGLIKANFPCRIAFRVASSIDSRTILDGSGAESLLGNGDMLFIPPGKSEPARLQGAFLASEETEQLLKWYTEQVAAREAALAAAGVGTVNEDPDDAETDIVELGYALGREENGSASDDDKDKRDKRFREAALAVIQQGKGSTSMLQRHMGVGYGRAARIIDQLVAAGVLAPRPPGVSPSMPLEVLVGTEDLERICS